MSNVRRAIVMLTHRERSQWYMTKVSSHMLALCADGMPHPLPCLPYTICTMGAMGLSGLLGRSLPIHGRRMWALPQSVKSMPMPKTRSNVSAPRHE